MKKTALLFSLFSFSILFSQARTEDFQISLPEKKVVKSLYKTIKVVDARVDTTNLGIVQKGAFNTKARVVPTVPINTQLQNVLNSLNASGSGDGEMLIYLKQLSFAEVTGAMSEKGYCYFQAFLFSKNGDGNYQPLNKIDSVIVHSSMDVTKATMRKGSEMIADFISKNIGRQNTAPEAYTYSEVLNYDLIEKNKYPLYSAPQLTDGLYGDFRKFRSQTPLEIPVSTVKAAADPSKLFKIYSNVSGKEKELKKSDYYALVYQGAPYLYSELDYAFVKATKRADGDYYLTAKAQTTAKTSDVMLASAFFGIIGGLIASASDANAVFEMKLDYINGGLVPVKEIKK
ncbi:MAG: hypothetical protein K0M63_05995 [Weeksellaceae bacterium]|nr:hypothetical protein [Weeksellaceae bacterium]